MIRTPLLRALTLVIGLVAAISAPPAAARSSRALSRKHFERAELHYQQGEFREALAEYKKAHQYLRHPAFLFNIAQCHRQLSEWKSALFFYRLYLNKSPGAPNRAEVALRIKEATEKLEVQRRVAAQVGRLSVVTKPEGAEIRVDNFGGPALGRSPAILPLPAGQHLVQISRPGFAKVHRTITVATGQIALLEVSLVPEGAGTVAPPGREAAPRGREATPPGRAVVPPGREAAPRGREATPPGRAVVPPGREAAPRGREAAPPRRPAGELPAPAAPRRPYHKTWWFGTTVALAGLALALGASAGGVALAWRRDYVRTGDPGRLEDAKDVAVTADVLFALAGAAAITAIVATVVYVKRGKRDERRAVLAPACGPSGCSLWVKGRF